MSVTFICMTIKENNVKIAASVGCDTHFNNKITQVRMSLAVNALRSIALKNVKACDCSLFRKRF